MTRRSRTLDSDDKAAFAAAAARARGEAVQLQFDSAAMTVAAKAVPAPQTPHQATLTALRNARSQIKVLGSATDVINQAHIQELDEAIARLTQPGGNSFEVLADSIAAGTARLIEEVGAHRRTLAAATKAIDDAIAEGNLAKMVHAVKLFDPTLAARLDHADQQLKLIAGLKTSLKK